MRTVYKVDVTYSVFILGDSEKEVMESARRYAEEEARNIQDCDITYHGITGWADLPSLEYLDSLPYGRGEHEDELTLRQLLFKKDM